VPVEKTSVDTLGRPHRIERRGCHRPHTGAFVGSTRQLIVVALAPSPSLCLFAGVLFFDGNSRQCPLRREAGRSVHPGGGSPSVIPSDTPMNVTTPFVIGVSLAGRGVMLWDGGRQR
jgi:hypothetical protein